MESLGTGAVGRPHPALRLFVNAYVGYRHQGAPAVHHGVAGPSATVILAFDEPIDPAWKDDAGLKGFMEFMNKYMAGQDWRDQNFVNGYNSAMVMEAVLRACGDDLSAANIMKQATAIKSMELPMLLPGIKVNTTETDFGPIQQEQLQAFKGEGWQLFGEIFDARGASKTN